MSSETRGVRQPPRRGNRRRKALPDLNVPQVVAREEPSSSFEAAPPQGIGGASQLQGQPEPPPAIDVEAIDDDVIISSPRSFAEAKYNAARTRGMTAVVDLDSERTPIRAHNRRNKCRRFPTGQNIIRYSYHINLESTGNCSSKSGNSQPPGPPPPPKKPTFTCPICLSPIVEETSTKCGHIFCRTCIESALAVQEKCPTCRKRVVANDLTRVFLPSIA